MIQKAGIELERNIINIVEKIKKSGISIYDNLPDSSYYFSNQELEILLDEGLSGLSVEGLPIRTRSKEIKTEICKIMGYPVPKSFKKTQPRFPNQNLDTYIQKASNLQIWNEEIDFNRRYAIIIVSEEDIVSRVIILTGDNLASLDKTGTLTKKYQARLPGVEKSTLFSESDTENVIEWCESYIDSIKASPIDNPSRGCIIPIKDVYSALLPLVGSKLSRIDATQERNRGAELQKIICGQLGFEEYSDNGQYPDIPNQLIEIKLQTSPTIDLGLHFPNSDEILFETDGKSFSDKDVRYVIFSATVDNDDILLDKLVVVTGEEFVDQIQMFGGNVQNSKIQIPLPDEFFKECQKKSDQ